MYKSPSDCSPVFKPYDQNQMTFLPPSLDELIPANHLVRVVNGAVERMDIDSILRSYKGGGASSYHPKMLLKIILYGYVNRIYSSREIAKSNRENVYFMWLSGGNQPDFRTINGFRSERLRKAIDDIFISLLFELLESGYVKLDHYFVDGSKFEADANKYSWVWAKNTKRYKATVQKKVKELIDHIHRVQEEEDREYGDKDLEEMGEGHEINSEELDEIARKIGESINNSGEKKKDVRKLKSTKSKIEKEYLPRLKKYEKQEGDLAGRNSCSRTDKEATFFRYKNNELLPSYNVMLGTENQFILNYSIHQKASDNVLLIPHLSKLKEKTGLFPGNAIGDAGFGSEENYAYLESNQIKNYLKYNTFHKEEKGKHKKNPFNRSHFKYDVTDDSYVCPVGRRLRYKGAQKVKTDNGYASFEKLYICDSCADCSYSFQCTRSKAGRSVRYNPELERYRQQAMHNLTGEEGIRLRKRRNVEVETVFGQLKGNMRYRKFRLRGLEKANIDLGLLAISHNIKKMFNQIQLEVATI